MKNLILKLLIVLLILFQINSLSAQLDEGKISFIKTNYSPPSPKIKKDKNKDGIDKFNKVINKTTKLLKYTLDFKGNESVFYLDKKLYTDSDDLYIKMATTISGGSGIYYSNTKTKEILHQTEVGGTRFLVNNNLDSVEWELKKETKLIGKYLCYKATTIKVVKSIRVFYKKVTAWYCPKIPRAFGPIGYGNLPGLILELNIEKGATFKVAEIIINPKEKIFIKKPKKGEKVSEDEFQESCKKIYYNLRNGM